MKENISARVERAIAERVFPGCVVGIVHGSAEREILPFGHLTYEIGAPEVVADTIYDVASITKSIPTASLALSLVEENKLSLSDTVASHILELRNNFGATVEDLLRYRVRGPQMSRLAHLSAEEMGNYIFEHGFEAPPGASAYTNLPAFLLGVVIERATGIRLDALAQAYFFDPLEMHSTSFCTPVARTVLAQRCAPTEVVDGHEIRGIPHDESARVFAQAGRAVGHAGLFSTAPDILNFLEALLRGQFPHVADGAEAGLGWQVGDKRFMGDDAGTRAFGKTGFTGTSVVVDRRKGLGLVVLSNRTYPHRPPSDEGIYALRSALADIVLAH